MKKDNVRRSIAISPELYIDGRTPYTDPYPHIGTITLSWPEIKDAVGYAVYTVNDLLRISRERSELKHLRKLLNKRKKQARARTGRR